MWNNDAPMLFDINTQSKDLIIIACDRAILTYQGNHDIATPTITLNNEPPSATAITIGNINGGNERVVEIGYADGTVWTESATIEIISYETGWNPQTSGIGNYGGGVVNLDLSLIHI